jgi:hypothetical protein
MFQRLTYIMGNHVSNSTTLIREKLGTAGIMALKVTEIYTMRHRST